MQIERHDELNIVSTVIDGGYCIGCGACSAVSGSSIKMGLDKYSQLQATLPAGSPLSNEVAENIEKVCPFSNKSSNEDELGKQLFATEAVYDDKIGYYISTYAGYVSEDNYRSNGSSGGMGSWIATKLLEEKLIDVVVHIHKREPTEQDKRLFHYQLSYTKEEVTGNSKSRYYPIELSQVMNLIRETEMKYLIIGVPCFIKAVRLLTNIDSILKDRIKFCIGLVCGHLKSTQFAEMVAWQNGIEPLELKAIDFRTKIEGALANRYGVTVSGNVNGQFVSRTSPPINQLYGTSWGLGLFKYNACDYCDDVMAETADVTIGDAWLPQYVNDSQGTNVIVIRNRTIQELFNRAIAEGQIAIDIIQPKDVIKSQKSGFDHRREGLGYRLFLADKAGKWRPAKRVRASFDHLTSLTRKRQEMRMILSRESHIAFKKAREKNSFILFKDHMDPIIKEYQKLYQVPFYKRALKKIKSFLLSPINKS